MVQDGWLCSIHQIHYVIHFQLLFLKIMCTGRTGTKKLYIKQINLMEKMLSLLLLYIWYVMSFLTLSNSIILFGTGFMTDSREMLCIYLTYNHFFLFAGSTSHDDTRLSSISTAWWSKLLSSCKWALLTFMSASSKDDYRQKS